MASNVSLRKISVFIIGIVFVILDMIFKVMSMTKGLVHVNVGISFGLFSDFSPTVLLLSNFVFLIAILILLIINRKQIWQNGVLFLWGAFWIIAGGFSNLASRIIWGGVPDYWHLMNLTSFNLADVMIDIGVVMICVHYLKLILNKDVR